MKFYLIWLIQIPFPFEEVTKMIFLLTKVVKKNKGGPAGLESDKCHVVSGDIVQAAKKLGREIKNLAEDNKSALLQLIGPESDYYDSWILSFLPECTGPY